ncbi:hypothetical protein CDAR_505801 [Caerostris darwini]|uniref:Uncharacterized protein n=1 Tax=Caerostris darwini TaxID=1538125 RepID=A0AAV4QE49_9ARAC|nr:hypothetical protein CDAR_505801 [Caerostris darwini]
MQVQNYFFPDNDLPNPFNFVCHLQYINYFLQIRANQCRIRTIHVVNIHSSVYVSFAAVTRDPFPFTNPKVIRAAAVPEYPPGDNSGRPVRRLEGPL